MFDRLVQHAIGGRVLQAVFMTPTIQSTVYVEIFRLNFAE